MPQKRRETGGKGVGARTWRRDDVYMGHTSDADGDAETLERFIRSQSATISRAALAIQVDCGGRFQDFVESGR